MKTKIVTAILLTLFLASMLSMAFNITPVAAGTDSWAIGDKEPEAGFPEIVDEFLVSGQDPWTDYLTGTETFDYYVGVTPLTDMPAGLADSSSVNIHFSVLTPGYFMFTYSKWGSETDEIWLDVLLDGTLIGEAVGAGEGVYSGFLFPDIEIFDRNMHTLTVKILGGHHWFDSFAFELEEATDEKILLGKITHEDAKSKVNAAVKYKVVDDKLILEFQTVYFVREDHDVQWLGYFIVPKFYDYPYTILNVWGKIFKPGRGGYTGAVVTDATPETPGGWLQTGTQWCGTEPTGDPEDALVFADVDQPPSYFAQLEAGMKIVIHQTIELSYTYSGTIDYCVRGISDCGQSHWEHRYTIGTL